MRTINLVGVIAFFLFLTGCSRKDKEPAVILTSSGTLHDSNKNCQLHSPSGTFILNSTPDSSCYITASVTVTIPGLYDITTDTVSGVSFAARGVFTEKGQHRVRMNPSGTFNKKGITVYQLHYDTSYCPVSITIVDTAKVPVPEPPAALPDSFFKWSITMGDTTYYGIGAQVIGSGMSPSSFEVNGWGDWYFIYPAMGAPQVGVFKSNQSRLGDFYLKPIYGSRYYFTKSYYTEILTLTVTSIENRIMRATLSGEAWYAKTYTDWSIVKVNGTIIARM